MTDRLSLYNGALLKLGAVRLAALTDEGKGRRALDYVFDKVVKGCLEGGFWNFAMRAVQLNTSPSIGSNYGYQYVFDKPEDWLRTAGLTVDAHGRMPLLHYDDRASFIFADIETIYMKYVSIHEDYGLNFGLWPALFVDYVECSLAWMCCEEVTGSAEKRERLEKDREKAKTRSSNVDAMNEPVMRLTQPGRLVQSRGSSMSREHGVRR